MFTIEQLTQLSNFLIEDFKGVFVTKEEMNTRFEEVNLKFDQLQTSVDGIVKNMLTDSQEIPALGNRVDNLEDWVIDTAPKVGVEYKP